jgi:dethiobiotin synthetase
MSTLVISGTDTEVGKTVVTSGLARWLADRAGCWAVKPFETGVDPDPVDAMTLATACRRPEASDHESYLRLVPPLGPRAAVLEGHPAADLAAIVRHLRALRTQTPHLLVEGAGGVLSPVTATEDLLDLASALDAPVLLVARDGLGVQSRVLTAALAVADRGLSLGAVVLNRFDDVGAYTWESNRAVLAERLEVPLVSLPATSDDLDVRARAIAEAGLPEALGWA